MSEQKQPQPAKRALKCVTMSKVAESLLVTLQEHFDESRALRTGIIDGVFAPFAGVPRGSLIVLTARPKVGKTTLAHQLAFEVPRNNESAGVVYYTAEMPPWMLTAKMISACSGIPIERWNHGDLSRLEPEDAHKLTQALDAAREVGKRLAYVVGPASTEALGEVLGRLNVTQLKPDLLVVDYLQRLQPSRQCEGRRAEIDAVLSDLVSWKQQDDLAIIAISSESRGDSKDAYGRNRGLGSCKESGDIEYDADMVLGLQLCEADFEAERKGLSVPAPQMELKCIVSRLTEPVDLVLKFERSLHRFVGGE